MDLERHDWMATRPVIWSPVPARLDGRATPRDTRLVTSLAAAGLALIVFTLSLLILTAVFLPGVA